MYFFFCTHLKIHSWTMTIYTLHLSHILLLNHILNPSLPCNYHYLQSNTMLEIIILITIIIKIHGIPEQCYMLFTTGTKHYIFHYLLRKHRFLHHHLNPSIHAYIIPPDSPQVHLQTFFFSIISQILVFVSHFRWQKSYSFSCIYVSIIRFQKTAPQNLNPRSWKAVFIIFLIQYSEQDDKPGYVVGWSSI